MKDARSRRDLRADRKERVNDDSLPAKWVTVARDWGRWVVMV